MRKFGRLSSQRGSDLSDFRCFDIYPCIVTSCRGNSPASARPSCCVVNAVNARVPQAVFIVAFTLALWSTLGAEWRLKYQQGSLIPDRPLTINFRIHATRGNLSANLLFYYFLQRMIKNASISKIPPHFVEL